MTPPAHIPFWVPIVASTLSNANLAFALPGLSANRLATLRTRFGLSHFLAPPQGPIAINWLVLLGQIEDEVLAELVTVRFSTVITTQLIATIREDLGITSFSARKPKLQPQLRDLVGRYSASNLAKGWGVSVKVIEAYRNLAAPNTTPDASCEAVVEGKWKQEWIELFPHQTNAQITSVTGISAKEVRAMRSTLRVSAPATRTYWKLVSEEQLDNMSDAQLSALYGGPLADYAAQRLVKALTDKTVAREIARTKRLPEHLAHLLNQMPLKRVAKLVAISEFHLKRQRDALGLDPYTPFPPKFEALLSTCSDSEVAEKTRTAVSTVRYRRDKLQKAAYNPRKGT